LRCLYFSSVFCSTKRTLFNCLKLLIDAFCSYKFQLKTTESAPKIKCISQPVLGQLRLKFKKLIQALNMVRIHILIDSLFYSPLIFHSFTYISSLLHLVLVMCDASIVLFFFVKKLNCVKSLKKFIHHVH